MNQTQIISKKLPFKVFMLLLFLVTMNLSGQSVKRQCIPCYSTVTLNGAVTCSQTVGQPYVAASVHENGVVLLPGFQQPVAVDHMAIKSTSVKSLLISLYPNPAAYSVKLSGGESASKSQITITDIMGNTVLKEHSVILNDYEINCSSWIDGLYFVYVVDENYRSCMIKLVVNKK